MAENIGKIEDALEAGEWIPYFHEVGSYMQNYYKSPAARPYVESGNVYTDGNGYWFATNSKKYAIYTNNEDGTRYIPTKGFKYMDFFIKRDSNYKTIYAIYGIDGSVIATETLAVSSSDTTITGIDVSGHDSIMLEVNTNSSASCSRGFGTIRFYN